MATTEERTPAGNKAFPQPGRTVIFSASFRYQSLVPGWTDSLPPAVFGYAPSAAGFHPVHNE